MYGIMSTVTFGHCKIEFERQPNHLRGLTDKVVTPHQGADGHLEVAATTVVLCDAPERVHDQQLLKGSQYD